MIERVIRELGRGIERESDFRWETVSIAKGWEEKTGLKRRRYLRL